MANQHQAHDPLHLIRQLLKVSQEPGRVAGSLGLQVLEHLRSSVHLAGTQAEQAPANLQHTSAVAAQLLSIAALLGVKDAKGGTPLLYAAQNGHAALVSALVVSGACPLTQRFDGSGNSALHVAAAQGHLPVVRFLLPAMQAAAAGTSTGAPDSKQGTDFAAHTAGSQCSTCSSPPSKLPSSVSGSQQQENAHAPVSMGEPWVTLPVQPTASSSTLPSTTTAAAAAGPDSASLSPVAPAPADLANSNGDTSLMFALSGGHMGIAAALLQAGASVLLVNSDGLTSLMLAAGGSHEHCVQLVLRAASKATRAEASTQVSMASAPASPAQDGLVGLLVAVDVFGNNALHYAARAGASSCVALILAAAHSAGVKHTEATESSVGSVGTSSSGSTAQGACRSQQPPGEHATSAQASSSSSSRSRLGCDALHALLLGRNTEGRTALTESRKARHKGCEEMLHQAWEQLSPQPPPTQDPSSTSTQQMPSAAKQPQATSKQTGTASPAEALPAELHSAELHSVASSSSFAAGAAAITAAAAADVGVAIAEAAEPQVEASNTSRVVPHAPREHSKSGTDNERRGGAWTMASSTGPQRRHAQQAAGPPAHAQHVVSVGANPRPGPAPGAGPGPGPGHADVSVGAGRSRNTLAGTVGAAGGATRPKATAAPSVPQRQQHSRHEMADDAAQASLGRSLNAPVSAPACAEQLEARIAATPVGGMKAQGWAGIVRGPAGDGAGCQSPSLSKPFSSEGWKRAISREMMASAGRLTGQAKMAPGQSVPDATAGGGTSHMAAGASAASAGAELNAAAATPANSAAISSTVKHDPSHVIQHGDELKEEGQIASSSKAAAADSAEGSTDEGHDPTGWLAEARIAMAKLLPDSAELDLSPWHMAGLGLSSLSGGQLDALAALHLKALLQVQSLVLEQAAGVQAQVAQEAQTRAQDIQRLLGKPGSSSPAV